MWREKSVNNHDHDISEKEKTHTHTAIKIFVRLHHTYVIVHETGEWRNVVSASKHHIYYDLLFLLHSILNIYVMRKTLSTTMSKNYCSVFKQIGLSPYAHRMWHDIKQIVV